MCDTKPLQPSGDETLRGLSEITTMYHTSGTNKDERAPGKTGQVQENWPKHKKQEGWNVIAISIRELCRAAWELQPEPQKSWEELKHARPPEGSDSCGFGVKRV